MKIKDTEFLETDLSEVDMTPCRKEPLNEHTEWIRAHLPAWLTEEILSEALHFNGLYRTGRTIYAENQNGEEDLPEFTSDSEEQIRMFEFDLAADKAAHALALRSRDEDRKQWRWDRDHAEKGRWMYIERKQYVYDAVFDERLAWFELYLSLIKEAVSGEWHEAKIHECTALLNRSFPIPHWLYDRKNQKFIEISHSRETDIFGRAEPSEDSIIQDK